MTRPLELSRPGFLTLLAMGIALVVAFGSWWVSPYEELFLVGSKQFREDTKAALRLLQARNQRAYAFTTGRIDLVIEWPNSRVYPELPLTVVTIGRKVRSAGPVWYASHLAHEAYHVYERNQTQGEWQGELPERRAVDYQRAIARNMGANDALLRYLVSTKASRYWEQPPFAQHW